MQDTRPWFAAQALACPACPTASASHYQQSVLFSNQQTYRSYRIIFPTTRGSPTDCMQLGEIQFWGYTGVPSDSLPAFPQPLLWVCGVTFVPEHSTPSRICFAELLLLCAFDTLLRCCGKSPRQVLDWDVFEAEL